MTQIPFYPEPPFVALGQFSSPHFWHCFFSPGHTIVVCFRDDPVRSRMFRRRLGRLDMTGFEDTIYPPGQIFMGIPLDLGEKRTRERETKLNSQRKTVIRMTLRSNSRRGWTLLSTKSLCIIVLLLWLRRINHEVIYWLKDYGINPSKEITPQREKKNKKQKITNRQTKKKQTNNVMWKFCVIFGTLDAYLCWKILWDHFQAFPFL